MIVVLLVAKVVNVSIAEGNPPSTTFKGFIKVS